MRVLVVADTHGHLDERIEALARASDLVVHAGDVGADEVLERLGSGGASVLAVRGNNDVPRKWRGDAGRIEAELPLERHVELPGGVLTLTHGDRAGPPARRHERLRQLHPGSRAVVYGHSHRACVDRDATPWILNPGAAGRARTYGGPSCLVVSAHERRWTVAERRFEPRPARRAGRRAEQGG